MNKLLNMIEQINQYISDNKSHQQEWYDDIFYQFNELCLDDIKVKIVQKSEIDEHRWYGTQELVFEIKLEDEVVYVKNRLVTQSYSEMQCLGDICWSLGKFKIVHPVEKTITVYEVI